MATIKRRLYRKNASGSYDTVHYESESSLILRPSGRTVEQDLADFLPKTQASDSPPASLKSLLGGTSKIWAGTNGGTVKELSLSGHTHSQYALTSHTHSGYASSSHTHSASQITSGTLSVSRGGTGYTSLSSLASALSPYLSTGGGSIFTKVATLTSNNATYTPTKFCFYIMFIKGTLTKGTGGRNSSITFYVGSTSVHTPINLMVNYSTQDFAIFAYMMYGQTIMIGGPVLESSYTGSENYNVQGASGSSISIKWNYVNNCTVMIYRISI